MFPDVAVMVTIPPCVNVTSVPVELFNVTGELVPVTERSVPPPEVAAIVTIPADPVPEVVRVTFAPSTNWIDPPLFDNVTV